MSQKSTRIAVTEALMELAGSDDRTMLLSTDSLLVLKAGVFREKYPDQCIELGISEQNGVDVASGMAASNLKPYLATYAGFITMRACEQVRTFIAYPGLDVTLIGANGGIGSGEREGVTHQFIEDIGIMRTIPGVTILVPADADQVKQAVLAAHQTNDPTYIRIGSGRDPIVYDEPAEFTIGKANILRNYGKQAVIIGCGQLLGRACKAADVLHTEGVGITVIDMHTIRPIDRETILAETIDTGHVITLEDHTVNGGLGSAVCEVLSEEQPRKVTRMGLQDCYARSGPSEELLDYYKLGISDIIAEVKKTM